MNNATNDNIARVRAMITRIRNQEGGIGSTEDELILHRVIHDIDLLLAGIKSMKLSYDELLAGRDARIRELESQLGVREEPPSDS